MRIALVNVYFAEQMGYADGCLARALSALGHEVHLVVSDGRPYFDTPEYESTYRAFLGPPLAPCGVSALDGYTLHRLPHARRGARLSLRGLVPYLRRLRPDVVQAFSSWSPVVTELALARPALGYRLFLGCHIHASVFPPARGQSRRRERARWTAYKLSLGAIVGRACERSYAISDDAALIAERWFGLPSAKVQVMPLGVDTDAFRPADTAALADDRLRVRAELGVGPDEVLCVYSGRFSAGKDPHCLARAVAALRSSGRPWRALFIGQGTPEQVAGLEEQSGSLVHPFVDFQRLGALYRAADIGVWPRQESTSQLDAVACGLPLVVSEQTHVRERIEGNGRTYVEGDSRDLARVLAELEPVEERRRLGRLGAERVRRELSWSRLARRRLNDYRAALAGVTLPSTSE